MVKPKAVRRDAFASYTVQRIPRPLWKAARIKAIQHNLNMHDVMLSLLRSFAAGRYDRIRRS